MSYIPPTASGISYNFLSGGYSPPTASGISFEFQPGAPIYNQTANLQAVINVYSLFQDTTFSQIKDRRTYALGYANNGIQILKRSTLYTGIRDFGAYIYGNPTSTDLSAFIMAIRYMADLGAYLKPTIQSVKDIVVSIGGHLPADLPAYLNIIEIRDILASITGEFFKSSADLGAFFCHIFDRSTLNLNAYIASNLEKIELPAVINSISTLDLSSYIKSYTTRNLGSTIGAVPPFDMHASIHGWDERFLSATANGVYGPYDLQAYIRVHPHLNLPADIHGWYSGTSDLKAYLEGWHTLDLGAFVNAVSPVDLSAVIMATGKSVGLMASIIPTVVRLKQVIQVSLLEHKNLKALVNFNCFGSGYANLGVSFGTVYKKLDLPAFIWGWISGDGVKDLGASVNTSNYFVEDKISIPFVPEARPFTQLRVKISASAFENYIVFDTQPIFFASYYARSLSAFIQSIPRAVDLNAALTPVLQPDYTELPDNVNPKSHVVVIKFNDRWQEEWRKFVEIMFKKDGPAPYHYFYVSGTGQVYRIDRSRHWTIWATSYDRDDVTMFDRANIRTKFIFNMSNYTKVDQAIRDLIDRVSSYRVSNMSAAINCVGGRNVNLSAYLNAAGVKKHSWAKYLKASINGV